MRKGISMLFFEISLPLLGGGVKIRRICLVNYIIICLVNYIISYIHEDTRTLWNIESCMDLTLSLSVSSAYDSLCKQFEPISGSTKRRA